MGNTPSTPPPLVSINASGSDVLVPYGTRLYACPPSIPGYHPPHPHGECQGGSHCKDAHHCLGGALREPVYSHVGTRPRRRGHGNEETDVNIHECEEESESTGLGELPLTRKESRLQDTRGTGGRRGMPGPYDVDPRPSGVRVGYAGLRGGQGHRGMHPGGEEIGTNATYLGMHPGMMYPDVYPPGANMSPHRSVPPRYTPQESMNRYPYSTGMHSVIPHASQLPRPPPPSTRSSTSSPKSHPRRLPSAIQTVIDAAIQKSTGLAHTPGNLLTKSKILPATSTKDKKDGWSDDINTCVCTNNCKCRKGERVTKWYKGTANIGGEEVSVRAKLNTRYVLKDDRGKDCGDHFGCKKKADTNSSSSSSSSDTEASESKKNTKKDKKKLQTKGKPGKLDLLQAELDKMKQAAAMQQGSPYGLMPFSGHLGDSQGYEPEIKRQLRMVEMSDPYRLGRVGGMDATGKTQGMCDPMTTRNPRLPRMPPKHGMQARSGDDGIMEDYEDMGGASLLNPYARPSVMRGKGKNKTSMPRNRQPEFGFRGKSLSDSDGELSTSSRSRPSKKGNAVGGRRARIARTRLFELNDTDVSLGPRRQSAMRGFGSGEGGELAMYNLLKRGVGDKSEDSSPRNERSRISPPGRRGRVRKGRTVGKQARAETDDDEDY